MADGGSCLERISNAKFDTITMTAAMCLLFTVLLLFPSTICHALSPPSTRRKQLPLSLAAVSQSQVAALDGAEWISLQWHLMERNVISRGRFSQVGSMTVVTGTNGKERVVGIQAPSQNEETTTIKLNEDTHIYKSSMATIPPSVSDQTAISTVLGALVGVHCVLPKLQHLGGSDDGDDSFVSGKVLFLIQCVYIHILVGDILTLSYYDIGGGGGQE